MNPLHGTYTFFASGDGLTKSRIFLLGCILLLTTIGIAFIHGAFAMGKALRESEIDLMVISEIPAGSIEAALEVITDETGRKVRLTALSADDFRKRVASGDTTMTGVIEESKIFLIGGQQELECLIRREDDLFSAAGLWT